MPFKFLALAVWIQMILSPSQPLLLSMGKSHYLFLLGLVSSVLTATGIIVATFVFKSIDSIALMILVSYMIIFLFATYLLNNITFNNKLSSFLKAGLTIGFVTFVLNITIYYFFTTDNIIFDFALKLSITAIFFLITLYKLGEHTALLNFLKRKNISD